jgi:hypothetical protein
MLGKIISFYFLENAQFARLTQHLPGMSIVQKYLAGVEHLTKE